MIAEYVWKHNGNEITKHRCPVGSPMDNELKRQLSFLQANPGGTCYFRREVETPSVDIKNEKKDEQ
jgi:hypothetical protein